MEYFIILKKIEDLINNKYKPGDHFLQRSIYISLFNHETISLQLSQLIFNCLTHLTRLDYLSRSKLSNNRKWKYKVLKKIDFSTRNKRVCVKIMGLFKKSL